MSLALLVVGVIDHGSLSIDCSGATPNSLGLLRLGRDLMRRSGGDNKVVVPGRESSGPRSDTPLNARGSVAGNDYSVGMRYD